MNKFGYNFINSQLVIKDPSKFAETDLNSNNNPNFIQLDLIGDKDELRSNSNRTNSSSHNEYDEIKLNKTLSSNSGSDCTLELTNELSLSLNLNLNSINQDDSAVLSSNQSNIVVEKLAPSQANNSICQQLNDTSKAKDEEKIFCEEMNLAKKSNYFVNDKTIIKNSKMVSLRFFLAKV